MGSLLWGQMKTAGDKPTQHLSLSFSPFLKRTKHRFWFVATLPGPLGREGGTVWSHRRRVWSGRHWSCGFWGAKFNGLSEEELAPPRRKAIIFPVGYCSPHPLEILPQPLKTCSLHSAHFLFFSQFCSVLVFCFACLFIFTALSPILHLGPC